MDAIKQLTLWLAAGTETIAAVRTALDFFLQQEIDKATLRRTGLPPTAAALRSDGPGGAPCQDGRPMRPQGL